MTGESDAELVVVEIDVPKAVEKRARERAGDDDLDEYLLDEYTFEYEWGLSDG